MLSTPTQISTRILVADDDPVIRHLVTSIIKKEGYTPVVVNDGREALRILQKDADFRAAIFDMMMPHVEGIEIIRHMRTEKRLMRIPVMMITSEQDLELMKGSFAAGATVFLPKPFTTGQLQTMLRMLLSKSIGADMRATQNVRA
ncbi:MAG: response regulator transcription factor [Rubrivivax sp.]|nr:response regulator transcription factor [Pyrinomonadaceae bacterium]